MGFFGSDSKTKKTTKITTTTNTTMGDIGLTGRHAVDMAAIMQTGAIEQSRIAAKSLGTLMQTTGKSAQQLIGGASDLVETQGEVSGGGSDFSKMIPWIAVAAIVALPALMRK